MAGRKKGEVWAESRDLQLNLRISAEEMKALDEFVKKLEEKLGFEVSKSQVIRKAITAFITKEGKKR